MSGREAFLPDLSAEGREAVMVSAVPPNALGQGALATLRSTLGSAAHHTLRLAVGTSRPMSNGRFWRPPTLDIEERMSVPSLKRAPGGARGCGLAVQ